MKDLYEQIKERLSPVETMYDIIRIVDPINKKSIIIKDKEIKNIQETCYDYWKKGETCINCISLRSYTEKDTFVKIEYTDNKVILITSTPINLDGGMYVIEMLKDISENGRIFDFHIHDNLSDMINEINEKTISDGLTGVYNRPHICDDYIKLDADRLSILNSEIQQVRDILNEMCLSSDEVVEDKQKLITSQYLDELIVKYMKNNMQ